MRIVPEQLLPGLWLFRDICNVYVVQQGVKAIAIDFGSGAWLDQLAALGIEQLEHVFLTHHHADQCLGLQAQADRTFQVHAPAGEEVFLDPAHLEQGTFDARAKGCPDSYATLVGGLRDVAYDMAGFTDFHWDTQRIRFLLTPGHSPFACSIVLNIGSRQVVFCGDAAHAKATVWQPYHLEWDHWTGAGALAAWEGVVRLQGIGIDMLCPSHGAVINRQPRVMLAQLQERLMAFYLAKGQISPGTRDCYVAADTLPCGARQLSRHLYQYGANGYLILSDAGEALIVDPFLPDMPALSDLLNALANPVPTACTASHYHYDHCDASPHLQRTYGTQAWLHPLVAEPLHHADEMIVPWLPVEPIRADALWQTRGTWKWNEYRIKEAPWSGQTRWHCIFMTAIDGNRVTFGGDSFQPSSRWNGTGGFCAYNGSRFEEGFARSAALLRRWEPDIVACGHGTYYQYRRAKYIKIERWAQQTERAVRALCPSGQLQTDYYLETDGGRGQPNQFGAYYWINAIH